MPAAPQPGRRCSTASKRWRDSASSGRACSDPPAVRQRSIKDRDKAPSGRDQHAMAHGHHRGDSDLQQFRRDTFGSLLGLSGLTGFEEDQRDAVITQQRTQFVGEDGDVSTTVEQRLVLGPLEAQSAETDSRVIDAVPIEMDDVIRLPRDTGTFEFLTQCRERRRAEEGDFDQTGQRLHRLDQRQGANAVVDVAAGIVIGPRRDQQDANGRRHDGHFEDFRVRQTPPGARGFRPLKQEAVAIVQQLPRQAEQLRSRLPSRRDLGRRRPDFQHRIHMHGEPPPGM